MKLPNTAKSMVWLVAPLNVKLSKPETIPAKLALADAVAANAAVIDKVSVPVPPAILPVGVADTAVIAKLSSPAPKSIALVEVPDELVTVSAPAPPVNVALEASIVTFDAPVVAEVFTAVTVAALKSAVMPAEPETVTVANLVKPAVEVKVKPLVPATVIAVVAPKVMLAKVELAPVVVTFNVV